MEIELKQAFLKFRNELEQLWCDQDFSKLIEFVALHLFESSVKFLDIKDRVNLSSNNEISQSAGIYCFWIKKGIINRTNKKDYESFKDKWNRERKERSLTQPMQKWFLIKDQILEKPNGYEAFYLGKRENLKNRIMSHIHSPSDGTYGMHLDRFDFMQMWDLKEEDFKIGWFEIPKSEKKTINKRNRQIQQHLISFLEQELRERLRPIVGKA